MTRHYTRILNILAAILLLGSSPLAQAMAMASAQVYYIHTDHLDTPRQITDTNGNLVWQWDNSDPFGNNPPNENPSGQGTFSFNLRFSGQYADKETNTYYNINRTYDPSIGRYFESDPIGIMKQSVDPLFAAYKKSRINSTLGLNQLYTYVGSDPISRKDPNGLDWDQFLPPHPEDLLPPGFDQYDPSTYSPVPTPKLTCDLPQCTADAAGAIIDSLECRKNPAACRKAVVSCTGLGVCLSGACGFK